MSRITVPSFQTATGSTAEVYAQIKKSAGSVPNLYAALAYLAPDSLKAILNAEKALANSSLSKQDIEVIKVLVSELTGCGYCLAAHAMLGKLAGLSPEVLSQVRAREPTGDAKRDALVRFVQTLQLTRNTISQEDFDTIRAAGYSETQLADIALAIALTIFTNTFNRINDTDVDFPPIR